MLNYNILSSGSNGNCVIIENVMVDCGIPFKRIKEQLYDVRYLLLTHIHGDHVNKATLSRIKKQFPKITILGNYEVHQTFGVDKIVANAEVKLEGITVTPFECVHNVVTTGYTWKVENQEIIYATDTSSLEHAPEKQYDFFFIESNHDEKKVQEIMKDAGTGYNPAFDSLRHLSTQKAKGFYYTHRKNKDSPLIELHKSRRFY